MPRPTPYEIYRYRAPPPPVPPTAELRTRIRNPYLLQFVLGEHGRQYRQLRAFCEAVRLERVLSPAHVVALWLVTRLFPRTRWSALLPAPLLRAETLASASAWNGRAGPVSDIEVLEMLEVARYYVQPSKEQTQRSEREYGELLDSVVVDVFNGGRAGGNDGYRLATALVLVRSAFDQERWARLQRFLWNTGACTLKALAVFDARARCAVNLDDSALAAVVAQLENARGWLQKPQ